VFQVSWWLWTWRRRLRRTLHRRNALAAARRLLRGKQQQEPRVTRVVAGSKVVWKHVANRRKLFSKNYFSYITNRFTTMSQKYIITTVCLCNVHCYVFRHFHVTVSQFTNCTLLSYKRASDCTWWKYSLWYWAVSPQTDISSQLVLVEIIVL
jgi:hypothetical protein